MTYLNLITRGYIDISQFLVGSLADKAVHECRSCFILCVRCIETEKNDSIVCNEEYNLDDANKMCIENCKAT